MSQTLLQMATKARDMGRRQNTVHSNMSDHMKAIESLVKRLTWQVQTRDHLHNIMSGYEQNKKAIPAEIMEKWKEFGRVEVMDADILKRLKELGVNLLIQHKQTISLLNDTQELAKDLATQAEPEVKRLASAESAFPFQGGGLTESSTKASPEQAQEQTEKRELAESLTIEPPSY